MIRLQHPTPSDPSLASAPVGPGVLLALVLVAATAGWVALPQEKTQGPSLLAGYDFSKDAGLREHLPRALEEVSGLATTPDGRLFAHADERAVIYQVDPETGNVLKAFSAGIGGTRGDFEGLAYARGRFYLMTSRGEILEVEEGEDRATLSFRVHPTGLGAYCEMEGLAFHPAEEALLLPCKQASDPHLRGHVVVFSVPLDTMKPYLVPRVFLSLEELESHGLNDEFHPSAIEVHPETGAILIVAAREEALLEVSPNGGLVGGAELKKSDHPQPEGLAFLPDGTLVLADEGGGKRGRITRYPYLSGAGGNGS